MRPPRSPLLLRMLAALEEIYSNPDTPAAERMRAIDKANRILNRRPRKSKPKAQKTGNVDKALAEIRKLQSEHK